MIVSVAATSAHFCCDLCGAERDVDYSVLAAGVEAAPGGVTDPNVVRLPPCSCGAVEFLSRNLGDGISSEHLMVNAVHDYLVQNELIQAANLDILSAEERPAAETRVTIPGA